MIRRLFFDLLYLFGRTPWDTGISPPELISFLEQSPPGRAIDLGCGTGTNVVSIAKRGWQVTGVDISRRAIRKAQRKAAAAGVSADLRQADVSRLDDIQGPFDLALDIGCFHSLPVEARAPYSANLYRILRPAGTYLLYSWINPSASSAGSPPGVDTIQAAFKVGFESLNVEYGTDRRRQSAWFTFRRKT